MELTKTAMLMMTLDSGNVSRYPGQSIGTMLEVDAEDGEEDDEERADEDPQNFRPPAAEGKKRSHSRFSAAETEALRGLLRAWSGVPSKKDLIEWVKRQGTGSFTGCTLASISTKLRHLYGKHKKMKNELAVVVCDLVFPSLTQ